jgi:thioredoxin-like negative regulator of GroEL
MVMDTLSHALAAEGRADAALAASREAVGLAAEGSAAQVAAQLQLARLLVLAERWPQAREALGRLPERAATAPRHDEVRALLRQIDDHL